MNKTIEPTKTGRLETGAHSIWWEYHGEGKREAVCLLNGLAMHTRAWYSFLPLILDEYDVILYDFPGQGQSSKEDVPYYIPDMARLLVDIMDLNEVDQVHLVGISYGGFVAMDFARLFQGRLCTLTLSGILLSHERLFEMYQEISLRFYRGTKEEFELYTYYMYEKIFGESFVTKLVPEQLGEMRRRFYDRYVDDRHCLIRLTEAQNPFFAGIEQNLPDYQAVETPVLLMAGEQDRAIPMWQQKKLLNIFPQSRWETIPESGHVVYLERADLFFPMVKRFMKAGDVRF
ncbi:MAG: alpha/beta hydrolase [Acidobacteria bacterium]|nr:alpha/beta hydrolase [Acidobacteriota bacterium]